MRHIKCNIVAKTFALYNNISLFYTCVLCIALHNQLSIMTFLLPLLLFAVGLVLLVKGADYLVEGASSLAKKFKVPELAIGLTIVAFGTSAPELVVNVLAAMEAKSDVVLGNIIGSNNFNLLFILGIAGLIYPLIVSRDTVWKEIPYSLVAALVLLFLANDVWFNADGNSINRADGIILLVMFGLFLAYIALSLKQDQPSGAQEETVVRPLWQTTLYVVGGLAGLVFGGKLVVDNAIAISQALGVSERMISLTIVSAGTSLPELATSSVAAYRRKSDLAVGNIIGSNIFNIFLILGISAIVKPIAYNPVFNESVYLLLGGTVLVFGAMFVGKRKILERWQAALLLLGFVAYTIYLVWQG